MGEKGMKKKSLNSHIETTVKQKDMHLNLRESQPQQSVEEDDDTSSGGHSTDDDEVLAPPGFARVELAKQSLTQSELLADNKEIWLFRLPLHIKAQDLSGLKIKLPKQDEIKADVAQLSAADVNYTLKSVDPVFSSQLVNAFPFAGSKTYQLGKPISREFCLVRSISPEVKDTPSKKRKLDLSATSSSPEKVSKKKKKSKSSSNNE